MKLNDLDDTQLMPIRWLADQLNMNLNAINQKIYRRRHGMIPENSLPQLFQAPHSRPMIQVGSFKKWLAEFQANPQNTTPKRRRGRPRKAVSPITHM